MEKVSTPVLLEGVELDPGAQPKKIMKKENGAFAVRYAQLKKVMFLLP